jgi:hypothetical protein
VQRVDKRSVRVRAHELTEHERIESDPSSVIPVSVDPDQ